MKANQASKNAKSQPTLKASIERYFNSFGINLSEDELKNLTELGISNGIPSLEMQLLTTYSKPFSFFSNIDPPFEVELYDKIYPNQQLKEMISWLKSQKYIGLHDVYVPAKMLHIASSHFLIGNVPWPPNFYFLKRKGKLIVAQLTGGRIMRHVEHMINPVNIFFKRYIRENSLAKIVLSNNIFFDKGFDRLCRLLKYYKNLEELNIVNILQSESFYLALYLFSQSRKEKVDIFLCFPNMNEIITMVRRTKCEYCFKRIFEHNKRFKGISRKSALKSFNSSKFNILLDRF